MHISAATILAVCVTASQAMLLPPRFREYGTTIPKPGDAGYIPGCTGFLWPAVYPPSAAQIRCQELEAAAEGKEYKKESTIINPVKPQKRATTDIQLERRRLPEVNEQIKGCKDTVFQDVFPPSKAELRCRGLIDDNGKPIKRKGKQSE